MLVSRSQETIIENVLVSLSGFTKDEIKDIIGYMRSVEAFRSSRIIFVKLEDPDMSEEEAMCLITGSVRLLGDGYEC